MTDVERKVYENRVRRMAERQRFTLNKSRRRDPRAFDYGKYHLTDENNVTVTGREFDLDLTEVHRYLVGEIQ